MKIEERKTDNIAAEETHDIENSSVCAAEISSGIKNKLISPSSHLEELSIKIKNSEEETRAILNNYYYRLAQDANESGEDPEVLYEEIENEVQSLKSAAANLKSSRKNTAIMADELASRLKETKKCRKKGKLINVSAPANSIIDYEERKQKHFAQGINFYKLFWVCFIGSFAGVVVELIWCFIRNGYIESRSGLVYGPFNLLYGAGAVALTLTLYRYRNRSASISFIGGMIVGSVVEYVCSWGQEMVFGSRSWDYSSMPFNINGRICLLYSVFWGILGVLWVKNIYPRMAKLILYIPNKAGKIISWILLVFMVINVSMTVITVYRWTQRMDGNTATNSFEEFIDNHFPDERMERIFANMNFGQKEK